MTTGIGSDKGWRSRRLSTARAPRTSVRAWIGRVLAAQRGRATLCLPLGVAAGAAAQLLTPNPPGPWALTLWLVIAALAALGVWRWLGGWRATPALLGALALVGAGALGAAAAAWRIEAVESPRLAAQVGPATLIGWVERADPGLARARLTVRVVSLEGVASPPKLVRVSAFQPYPPGRWLRCRVILRPPEPPLAPGGYDGERRDYFLQVGGSGFALGACRALAPQAQPTLATRIAAWRRDLAETIAAVAPGDGGALAAALVTGDRSLISAETQIAFRDSGLGHLLSVSGLHMALVAGMTFALVRRLLALIPPLALRAPVGKLAAGVALGAAAAYLVVSGASVPAQRAFVMTAVALGAVLLDRPAFTMRGLAFAALIILLGQPEAVLDPGFQMSFTATAALIAAFETIGPAARDRLPSPGPIVALLRRIHVAITGSLATSLVAGLATDPIALHHFQRFTVYSLPANLAAAPVITVIVAPAAVAAAALAPFGLAEWPLAAMAAGLDQIRAIGAAFASRPEAVQALPHLGGPAFVLAMIAIYWACVWRGAVRALAAAPGLAAAALAALQAPPVLLLSPDARVAVVRVHSEGGDGWRVIRPPRGGGGFAVERLAGLAGIAPREAAIAPAPEQCDADRCAWTTPAGRRGGFAFTPAGLEALCAPGAIIASRVAAPAGWAARCRPAALALASPRRGGALITERGGVRLSRPVPLGATAPFRRSAE